LSVFIGGLLFGWLRILSKGLAAPILAHSLMNGWVFMQDWSGIAQP
jgi:membrane protease YdiL (CAAX protease family)